MTHDGLSVPGTDQGRAGGWSAESLVATFRTGQVRGVRVWSPAPSVVDVVTAAEAADWRCVVLDTAGIVTKRDVIAAFGRAFPLPSYLGHNWDALEEALGDVEPGPHAGIVVVWTGWMDYAAADPDGFAVLLAICRAAAREWSRHVVGSAVTLRAPAHGSTNTGQAAVAALPRVRPD
ncbi:MAG: hypothetical protein QG597_4920 [Actinomycetota bacterium]|nr:hypothetical protein [Actinomycetota bacterium]